MTRWSASQFAAYRQKLIDEKIAAAQVHGVVTPSKDQYSSDWERRYADLLELRRMAGDIKRWSYETLALKFEGSGLRYTPDFPVINTDDRLEIHEVKGRLRREDRQKLCLAIALFPEFHWYIVRGDMIPRRMLTPKDVPAADVGRKKSATLDSAEA